MTHGVGCNDLFGLTAIFKGGGVLLGHGKDVSAGAKDAANRIAADLVVLLQ